MLQLAAGAQTRCGCGLDPRSSHPTARSPAGAAAATDGRRVEHGGLWAAAAIKPFTRNHGCGRLLPVVGKLCPLVVTMGTLVLPMNNDSPTTTRVSRQFEALR